MRIWINEFIKTFYKKWIILAFLGLAIINGVLLYVNESSSSRRSYFYTPKAYKSIYSDLSGHSNKEALNILYKQYEKLEVLWLFGLGDDSFLNHADFDVPEGIDIEELTEEYRSGRYLKYTNHIYAERNLYRNVIAEIETCEDYQDYLDNIHNEAETISSVSIFKNRGGFSNKNIIKTSEAYRHLHGNTLNFGPSGGVRMATQFTGTDVIAVLMMIIVVVSLLTREKELSQHLLIKSQYHGRGRLVISKLFVAFTGCFIITLLLYGINLLVAYLTYGYGDTDRLIQSVSGYLGSNMAITVRQYFILYILLKLFVYILTALIMFLIAAAARESVEIYLALIFIFGVSAVCYYTIEPTSYLSLLKLINIVSFLNTHTAFNNYFNINMFGIPVFYPAVMICAIIAGIFLCSFLSVYIFCKQKSIVNRRGFAGILQKIASRIRLGLGSKTTRVFSHELYKILIGGKALLILLVFAGITVYTYEPMKESFSSPDDIYYKQYMLKLEGELNDDKLQFIYEEEEKFNKIYNEMMEKMAESESNRYIIGAYSDLLAPRKAFEDVKVHTEYLKGLDNGYFLYDSGYKLLTGESSARNKDLQLALIAVAMTIACLTYVYSVEYQTGVSVLINTCYKGRRYTFLNKLAISVIIITMIYVITYAPYFYNVLSTYGTRALSAPAVSMEHLSGLPGWISIFQYLVIISLMRYIGLVLAVLIIFGVSAKLKSYIAALLAGMGILILPLLMSMLNITFFDYVLLNPLMIGNIF